MNAAPIADADHRAILARARAATGAGELADRDARVSVDNPLCGDRVTMDVRLAGDSIAALAHDVRGCLLCQAAASVIGARAPGCSRTEIEAVHAAVKAMLDGDGTPPDEQWADLAMFASVGAHRNRHQCVLTPFEALRRALDAASAGK